MSKEISTIDLGNMIADYIQEQPYFNREDFIKQFRALTKVFRLRLETFNYNKIEKPTQTAKLIRNNHLMNLEKDFFKEQLEQVVGHRLMIEKYYPIRDKQREIWGSESDFNYFKKEG